MAQTGYTPILIYSSSTAAAAPAAGNLTNSTLGSELAINITDGKLFYKDNANAIQVIGWKTVPTTAGGTGLTSYTAGDLLYYATGTTLTKLGIGAANTVLTSSGSAPQWSTNLSIGSLTATSISDSGNLTFTGTGNRITGDFSDATAANRVLFQTSTVNGFTAVSVIPNGTSTSSFLQTINNANPANASTMQIAVGASESQLSASRTGTGTFLPMTFYTSGTEKLRIAADTTGTFTFGGTAPRITGDFSNTTASSRVIFQSSTTNGATTVTAMPNGTSNVAGFMALPYSAIVGNASNYGQFSCSTTEVKIDSGILPGGGGYVPITIFAGGSERARFFTSGGVSIGNTTDPGAGNLRVTGSVLVNAVAGIGYATGAGGAVTQGAGSGKATTVTLDKPTGQITMNNANLNAGATVNFTCNCNQVAATDVVAITVAQSGAYTASNYRVFAYPTAGNFIVSVWNWSGGNLAEAIVLNYTIIKGVAS